MAPWLVVWLVLFLTTTALLVAFAIALVRHGIVLGRTARRMSEEVGPIAEDIRREGDRASRHASELQPPRWRGRERARG
jgi:hypothetical protein